MCLSLLTSCLFWSLIFSADNRRLVFRRACGYVYTISGPHGHVHSLVICLVGVFGMGNLIGTAFETDLSLSTLLATMIAVLMNLFRAMCQRLAQVAIMRTLDTLPELSPTSRWHLGTRMTSPQQLTQNVWLRIAII